MSSTSNVKHNQIDALSAEIQTLRQLCDNIPTDPVLRQRILTALNETEGGAGTDSTVSTTIDAFVTDIKAKLTTYYNAQIDAKTLEIEELTIEPPLIKFFDDGNVVDGDQFTVDAVTAPWAFDVHGPSGNDYFDAGDRDDPNGLINVGVYSWNATTTKFVLVP